MKLILIAMLFISSLTASAQFNTYHPFPDSSAFWNVNSQGCCFANCSGPITNPVVQDFEYTYFLSGDTLINNTAYNKLYRSGSIHEHCFLGGPVDNWSFVNNEYVGSIRQDTSLRHVYYIETFSASECLLYDFSLNVGDTLYGNCIWFSDCAEIVSIDSVLAGNSYRKRFNLATNPPYSVIEGIGSTSGLLEPLCPFEYFGELICFSQEGQTLYTNGTGACNNYTYLGDRKLLKQFQVFPNPVRYVAEVKLFEPVKNCHWILYNSFGMEVKRGVENNKEFQILREALAPGIYMLQIFNNNYLYPAQKIIIE